MATHAIRQRLYPRCSHRGESTMPVVWALLAICLLAAVAQAQPPELVNTGLDFQGNGFARGAVFTEDGKVAIPVREATSGDLNGDSDTSDFVLHVFDPATGVAVNVGAIAPVGKQAHEAHPLGGGLVAFHDQSASPREIWVYDIGAGTVDKKTAARQAWSMYEIPSHLGWFAFVTNNPDPQRQFAWSDAFSTAAEGVPGLTDLGPFESGAARAFAQGGMGINVSIPAGVMTVDPISGVRTHIGPIGNVPYFGFGPSLPGPDGFSLSIQDDKNSDNVPDSVYVVAPDGTITDLGGGPYHQYSRPMATAAGGLVLVTAAGEIKIWDGSTTAPVISTIPKPSYSIGAGVTATVDNAGIPVLSLANGGLVTQADERGLGDLTGDGSAQAISVYQVWDPTTGLWHNTGFPYYINGPNIIELASGEIVFEAQEKPGSDLNGDGFFDDVVLVAWDQATQTLVSSGIASRNLAFDQRTQNDGTNFTIGWDDFRHPSHALFGVFEGRHGGDLNGDADQNDLVLHAWNKADGLHNYGLAIETNQYGDATGWQLMYRTRGHGVVAAISEVSSGDTDLNGDGDATDRFLAHVVLPGGPSAPGTPEEQISGLLTVLDDLVAGGALAPDRLKKLQKPLNKALDKLDKGLHAEACVELQKLIDQTNQEVAKGSLSQADADALIDAVVAIRSQLGCP